MFIFNKVQVSDYRFLVGGFIASGWGRRYVSVSIRVHVQEQVKRAELQFQSLPQKHQNLLPNVLSHLAQVSKCAEKNHELLQAIVHNSLHMFENIEYGQRVRLHSQLFLQSPSLISGSHKLTDSTICRRASPRQISSSVTFLWLQMNLQKIRPSSTFDMDKLKSTMKQFVRDWSEDGRPERDSCYRPIVQEIQRLFPSHQ